MEGTEIGGDLSAVASLRGFEELHLGANCLGGWLNPLEGLTALRKVTIPPKHPWMQGWPWPEKQKPGAPELQDLYDRPCNGSAGVTSGILALSGLTGLEVLDLSYNALTMHIEGVEKMTLLTELALNENFITGNISSLRNLSGLKFLGVGGYPREYFAGQENHPMEGVLYSAHTTLVGDLSEVSHLASLTHLDISESEVGGEIASLRNLTDLAFLNVAQSYVEEYSDGDKAALGGMVKLRFLDIGSWTWESAVIVPLTSLTSLTHLSSQGGGGTLPAWGG